MVHFTVEELSLLSELNNKTRREIIDTLSDALPHYSSEEHVSYSISTELIKKLNNMSDSEFSEINYTKAINSYESALDLIED